MNFDGIIADLKANKLAGRAYERVGAPGKFRDRVTVYRDGKLLFERFCYGEAAGRVCTLQAPGADASGRIAWDYDACPYSGKKEAPATLTGAGRGALVFDGKPALWQPVADLATDAANGYGKLRMFFLRLLG